MRTIVIVIALALSLTGCSFFSKKNPQPYVPPNPKVVEELNRAVDLLGEEKYAEANEVLNGILSKHPATELDMVIHFNSGAALEGMQRCQEARDRYRQIVLASKTLAPRVQAQALHRLGYVYECLGDDAKSISSLIDAWKRRQHLPREIGLAEIPARLAAAYGRVGNLKMAQQYYKEAESGVKLVQAESRESKNYRDLMARTLYFMGRPDERGPSPDKLEQYLIGLRLQQRYLIQSVNLASQDWSSRARDELLGAYERLWKAVGRLNASGGEDRQIEARNRKAKESDVLQSALVNLRELKNLRFPDPQEPPLIVSLYNGVAEMEHKVTLRLSQLGVGTELTPEAERREGLRREGRVRESKPSVLEKRKAKSAGAGE